jgi:hypothetical protein
MAKKKSKPAKSGRITLRVKPGIHQELAETADGLGIDINGLLNLMIHRFLPVFSIMAWHATTMEEPHKVSFDLWRKSNPTRPTIDFFDDIGKLATHSEVTFEDGTKLNEIPQEWRMPQP